MATYEELGNITSDVQWGELLKKIRVAADIKAAAVIDSTTPGATVLEWAKQTIADPKTGGDELAGYVVAANNTATIAQIYSAADNVIQANVDAAVDALYGT